MNIVKIGWNAITWGQKLAIQTSVFSLRIPYVWHQTQNSALIGAMSAFNCIYLGHYFSDRAEFVKSSYFKVLFQNLKPKLKHSKNRIFVMSQ